ncbi:unnamed protein product [Arabis nemorensis]|uniref:F-box domain-containing protein n=1 Tax=Arabis nemorensis TaxID=586526 RepID=A0A565CHC1_9BRAS|nr:unnamed protein product [Arabis nemorensis]
MSPNVSSISTLVIPRVLSSPTAVKQQKPLKRKRENEIDNVVLMAMHEYREPIPPSWEILSVLAPYMEPETLAIACCVSTTWLQCFSYANLWKSTLTMHNDLSYFANTEETMIGDSFKRIVSAVQSDAKRCRRNQPSKPKISLSDLIFIVHMSTGSTQATIVKKGKDLAFGSKERFQIVADVSNSGFTAGMKEVRMLWRVVVKDYRRLFTIKDTVKSLDTKLGWFTDELPAPESRYFKSSNLVGDVKPSFNGEVLDKVGFAFVDSSTWESLFVDDVMRYLQLFLVD